MAVFEYMNACISRSRAEVINIILQAHCCTLHLFMSPDFPKNVLLNG